MPNTLQPFSGNNTVGNNPLNQLSIDAVGNYLENIAGEVEQAFIDSIDLLIDDVNSAFGLNLPDATTVVNDLQGLLSDLDFGGGNNIVSQVLSDLESGGGLASIVQTVESDLVNTGSTLVGFVEGIVEDGLSVIGIGSLSTVQPNLLPTPIFSSITIPPNPDWSADPTSERTTGNGSVMVVADGRRKALRSGVDPTDVIAVGSGQTITATIYAINQGYSGAGDPPVQLQLALFNAAGFAGFTTIATYTPKADITDWSDADEITGNYAVADGITGIQARLLVNDTAFAGTFHLADGSITQVAQIQQSWISGLEGALTSIQSLWQTGWDALASTVSGLPFIGADVADMVYAIANFNPANIIGSLGPLTIVEDLGSIVGHLIDGIKGQPAGTTTNASLADLYNAVNQAINNTANEDVTVFYDTSTTVPINSWALTGQMDLIGMGQGQDGEQGEILNFFGQGGQPGQINATSLIGGTHYDAGTPHVTVTINDDGSITLGVPAGDATAAHSITAQPGSGTQSPHFGSGYMGIGPGPFTYNGKTYAGGGNQNTTGAPGLGPGGGGAGGNGTFFQAGGAGAPAGGWVRQVATPISGGSTGVDTSPPTGGTGTVTAATNDTLTFVVTGATDV